MGYELRTNTIEPRRNTFDHLVERFGDKPATRYQEASYNQQPMENFHYRPFWDPEHEIYDPDYSVVKLSDADGYADPRNYYYNTYVSARADLYDGFGKTLKYLEDRQMFDRLPEGWQGMMARYLLPLRHYESGAQLISVNACRFAWGSAIAQAAGYAAMDRIGNAQMISMVGLAVAAGGSSKLVEAKHHWLTDPKLQELRKLVEYALIEPDWVSGLFAVELVDAQLYPLMYSHLEERAIVEGAGAYSLLAQHFNSWYRDHQKWLNALMKAWTTDPKYGEANRANLSEMASRWYPHASAAVRALAAAIAAHTGEESLPSVADRVSAEAAVKISAFNITISQ